MALALVFVPAAISFLISFLATPLVIKSAGRLGLVDDPKKRTHPATLHTNPTPRGGAIPLFLAIAATAFIFLPLDQRLVGILLPAFLISIVGILDDKYDLNPYLRLGTQVFIAAIVVASGIGIAFISNPFSPGVIDLSWPRIHLDLLGEEREVWILSAGFGFLWVIGLMNAVSWSSGIDGQLSGVGAIAALVITLLSLNSSADITSWPATTLAAATFGAMLGFFPWHLYPQKIMPGFGGATLVGFMLAVLSILTTAKVGTLLMVLTIPVVDAFYTVVRRVASGKSPVWADKGHLHHKLLVLGFKKTQIAIFYWIATAVLGIMALSLNSQAKFYTIVGAALFIGAFLVWVNKFLPSLKPPGPDNR